MFGVLFNEMAVSGLALTLAGWGGICDWRSRRIPNWLTVPALFVGLGVNTLAWGWPGTKAALQGAGLGLGLLLPFVLARGLGAGDWKLMGALGAFLGPQKIFLVLLGTVLIAGLMAAVEMIRHGRVRETLDNVLVLMCAFATFRVLPAEKINLDNPGLMALPFGVATALAMALLFCGQSALVFF
jgi:prepilin peptidase CpaA